MKKSLIWHALHTLILVCIVTSLLSGLRIATQHRDYLLGFTQALPQGNVHFWHFASALALLAVALAYMLLKLRRAASLPKVRRSRYHQILIYAVYVLMVLLMLTGISVYTDIAYSDLTRDLHYLGALLMLAFIFAHGFIYVAQFGFSLLLQIFLPSQGRLKLLLALSGASLAIVVIYHFDLLSLKHRNLPVYPTATGELIDIDGHLNETTWQNIQPIQVMTSGGANFVDGATEVSIRAARGQGSIYFYISWDDPTQSLAHLPLQKTADGWKVMQDGFYRFDERQYYEDKFAVMVSDHCEPGGAGTAHLGHKPLKNQPRNWHGKGYHYAMDGQSVDLWHWKAVRTNRMRLADDNFVSAPIPALPGNRRYTAGYRTDIKESGSYVLNWKWYKPDIIVPKRLPKQEDTLLPYQDIHAPELQWAIPWFDYQPYQEELDSYPEGTILPSVLHSSNRFEGDRADVNAVGRWENGKWHLEIGRNLDTHSDQDVTIQSGTCIWVSAFDHSQTAHTRHNYALKLEFK